MSSPKERLKDAGHRLAGAAEWVEEITDETNRGTCVGCQGEIGKQLLTEGLEKVKGIVTEIEEIIR